MLCNRMRVHISSTRRAETLEEAQVPLLRVLEEVQPVRVPGRQPLFQSWFDIQPVSFEGDLSFEGLGEISKKEEVRFAMESM